jgi:hypothetical protein
MRVCFNSEREPFSMKALLTPTRVTQIALYRAQYRFMQLVPRTDFGDWNPFVLKSLYKKLDIWRMLKVCSGHFFTRLFVFLEIGSHPSGYISASQNQFCVAVYGLSLWTIAARLAPTAVLIYGAIIARYGTTNHAAFAIV